MKLIILANAAILLIMANVFVDYDADAAAIDRIVLEVITGMI